MGSFLVNPRTNRPLSEAIVRTNQAVPLGSRALISTAGGAVTALAPASAGEGECFAVTDSSGNAATNPITVNGNGRLIDGAASVLLSSNNIDASFVLDDGEWRRVIFPRAFSVGDAIPMYRVDDLADFSAPVSAPFFMLSGTITIAGTGPLNNQNADGAGKIRFTGAAPQLNGLTGGRDGRVITLVAVGGPLVLNSEDPGSDPANRIVLATASGSWFQESVACLVYDVNRWREISGLARA